MAKSRTNKKSSESSRLASLRKRAAGRGYTLHEDKDGWYAEIAGTRYGPLATLDDVDEFLPKEP